MLTRRHFLRTAAATGLAFTGLQRLALAGGLYPHLDDGALGPRRPDATGLLELPEGFTAHAFSTVGETMDDGLRVPGLHDGMAAFPGADGTTILVRNHELDIGMRGAFPWGDKPDGVFDLTTSAPCPGGTTTVVYDTARRALLRHHLSLGGTLRNCAGGPTPWNSWLTCEETVRMAGESCGRDHGWVFEVPAAARQRVPAAPLRALGRFNHEAAAVEPSSEVVYLSEDQPDSLLYRFVPDTRRDLSAGRLQALVVRDRPGLWTHNWEGHPRIDVGETLPVEWIDLDDVESLGDDLRHRGAARGAARFARGEGLWSGLGAIWFACTLGGRKAKGQIWRYTPSPVEGRPGERERPAGLQLHIQPDDAAIMENCDNITVAPFGHLIACEDGPDGNRLLGVTPAGRVYVIARNLASRGEFAGACFSPDGTTLFVNLQWTGHTVAITGPWARATG